MNKLKNSIGFTLSEVLVAVLIMVLASIGMVTAVVLSNNQLTKQTRLSEANELYTTLSSLITNELRYTGEISLENGSYKVSSFYSSTYAQKNTTVNPSLVLVDEEGNIIEDDINSNVYGYLALGSEKPYKLLVGVSTYGSYDLGANAKIQYNQSLNLFTVTLKIGVITTDDDPLLTYTFNVRPMNTIIISGGTS